MNKYMAVFFFIFLLFLMTSISIAGPVYTLIYVVQQGDTLSEIAEAYGITTRMLMDANNLSKDEMIKMGEELIIPRPVIKQQHRWDQTLFNQAKTRNDFSLNVGSNYSVRINPGHARPDIDIPPDKIINYYVGFGDTLYDLARNFNTSIGTIMALNQLGDSIIRVGDMIRLPINNLTPRQILSRTVADRDLELLARVIHGEARGEPFIGQIAVGAVIINRVLSNYFPDTFYQVIFQKGQFSAVADGQYKLAPNRTAYRAAREALRGIDPTNGAMYYYNPKTAKNQWWFKKRRMLVTIGDHVFTK